jgi:hypothetical protein
MKITSQTPSKEESILARQQLYELFSNRPFDDADTLVNLSLFMSSGSLSKLLFLNEIYQEIVKIPGCIFEFGTYLGGSTIAFENLRAVYEPYNHLRRIFTFDTFQGYINVETESGISSVFKRIIDDSTYTTPIHYAEYLRKLMSYHEAENVMSHIKKHQIIEGDVVQTVPGILQNDQSIIIALAYFDLAMFEPTLSVLKAILPRMLKGSLIVLDELGHPDYPSESRIFFELLADRPHVIKKSEFLSDRSFITLL